MKRIFAVRLTTALIMGIGLLGGTCAAPQTSDAVHVIQDGAVSRAVGASVLRTERGMRILVDGLAFSEVTAWSFRGSDIADALDSALADGSAVLRESDLGFELDWNDVPQKLHKFDSGLVIEAASKDIQAAAEPLICPIPAEFGAATEPPRLVDTGCSYGSTSCLQPGMQHAGLDYSGNGNAIAIADGTVVRVETLNANDHGMGINILIRHILPGPNCDIIYSNYSHLGSIDAAVTAGAKIKKGKTIGPIGGSGNGALNAFEPHLHLEVKSRSVAGNPFGVGDQTKTCATDPVNAKQNTCWRYVADKVSPDDYGYLNPAGYLRRSLNVPVYRQVSTSMTHTCALKADNTLVCWGYNYSGESTPPSGFFKNVSVGYDFSCALRADNTLACWGDDRFRKTTPPAGIFKQLETGWIHACAIRANDTLACWGNSSYGITSPPAGRFKQVSAGWSLTCAIRADNSLACWGSDAYGQTLPPTGTFKELSAGFNFACAIKVDSTSACWGNNSTGQATPRTGQFKQVSAGTAYTCALRADDTLACWGYNEYGQAAPPAGSFKQVTAGDLSTCALRDDNTLACWGDNFWNQATVPIGTRQLAIGGAADEHACALKADASLGCWGSNSNGKASPPPGAFTQVVTGTGHSCALQPDGAALCWGFTGTPLPGPFKQLSAALNHDYALKEDGTLAYWSPTHSGQGTIPRKQVSTGWRHTCRIRMNHTLACSGDNTYGQAKPPSGQFTQVSAGDLHNCAIQKDNYLSCWGRNDQGQATAPSGAFRQVSAGVALSCGVRDDYTLACWGKNDHGQATPPGGTFLQVSAGNTAACAVGTNRIRVCWGAPF